MSEHNAWCTCVDAEPESTIHRGVCITCGWTGASYEGDVGIDKASDEIYAHLHDAKDKAEKKT